ncbi:MAG TPA: hypothetical protein PLM07_02545 [Candidatus Rifleibacterium sp.]|nr:hypothetical protein [Candidatus Rifleibacterium sp.]HPT44762.1 hypothetical protein [Candidatus Rifleibacterium sp.]
MLKKFFIIFFFSILLLPTAAETILVDTRLMLLAHPLFEKFDPVTGRFKGTSSEFIQGGQDGVDALIAEIKKINTWLLNSPKHLQEKLRLVALPDRMTAERAFLNEKRQAENRLATLQVRVYNARLVPGRPGVTHEASIIAQINEIGSDLRAVLKQLKERYDAKVIIDGAELLPIVKVQTSRSALLTQNLHRKIFKNEKSVNDKDFAAWLEEADNYWAGRLGLDARVVPVGARDVRLEAIKLMEERTKGLK